jgi:hypothetical protein
MPSWDIFEHQTREYQDSVLPPEIKARVAVEQASTLGWERYVGREGCVIGIQTFGASAPLKELQKSSASKRTASWQSRRNCWPGISTCPVFIKNGQGRMRTEGAAAAAEVPRTGRFQLRPSAGLNR